MFAFATTQIINMESKHQNEKNSADCAQKHGRTKLGRKRNQTRLDFIVYEGCWIGSQETWRGCDEMEGRSGHVLWYSEVDNICSGEILMEAFVEQWAAKCYS